MYLEWGAKGPPEESAGPPKWGRERPRRHPWSEKGDIELTMVFTGSAAPRVVRSRPEWLSKGPSK